MIEIRITSPISKLEEKKVYPDIPLTSEIKNKWNKYKDSVMHKEMKEDLKRFLKNLPKYTDKQGIERIKCEICSFMIPVTPKSYAKSKRKKKLYRRYLKECIKPKSKLLEKFKEFEIIVYIYVYFSKRRYSTNVDNIAKPIIDAMKPYFQGDSKVKVLIVEKKMLDESYPKDDLNYLQNSMIIIVDSIARNDIFKI